MNTDEIANLVDRARGGDEQAWNAMVREFSNLVWSTVRGFRLSDAAAADAVQTTWLRLVEHLDAIREPDRLAGWLRTTCRRVCLETVRDRGREYPVDPQEDVRMTAMTDDGHDEPEASALHRDDARLVAEALRTLDERDRALLTLLGAPQKVSYQDIAARLGMPVGSIGPTRARALSRLRTALLGVGLVDLTP